MFLKSLTLKGFKSFAEPTTLQFEPGVTVVVGPNGSGKSNLVDAVAWVLGAQGPRALRSGKMEDVIFAGSAKRPALGRAEVSLTIDNSAGLLPIEFSEVTITRTLFRSSGDSDYALNGAPCRLLDIQELLSDSGVGRQQHVIVGQGQLDTVLNARPEDRRMIVEEAAGVLKYRRRKEKAERRLEATEANLVRLSDLVREVRRQLRPLERQADAARRHDAVAAELRALRLHLAGRELVSLRARTQAAASARADAATREARVKSELGALDNAVLTAEASLSRVDVAGRAGGLPLGDVVGRYEALRERARGLAALLAERRRSVERSLAIAVDASLVAATEAEAARARDELAEIEAAAVELMPHAEELAAREAELVAQRTTLDEEDAGSARSVASVRSGGSAGSVAGTPRHEAAEVRGELTALRTALDHARAEAARREEQLNGLRTRSDELGAEWDHLRAEVEQADRDEQPLLAELEVAESRRAAARQAGADAQAGRRAAEVDAQAWSARAGALALALDEARARAGAERLAGVAGVVGTLLELVEVDEGWEAAFEAAAGEAIAAVLVADVGAARRAIEHLRDTGAAGAVLALEGVARPMPPAVLPLGGEAVRTHVRAALPTVERLLDELLATAVAVDGGWVDALDLAMENPGVLAVTRQGDRFAAGAWRTGAGGAAATGAALEEARARAAEAAAAMTIAEQREARAQAEEAAAAEGEAARARALDAHDAGRAVATEALQRVEAARAAVATEAAAIEGLREELSERIARDVARVAALEASLPALEAEEAAGIERELAHRSARRRLEEQAGALAALRTDLEVRAASLEQRRTLVANRLAEADERLARLSAEREVARQRREVTELVLARTDRLAAMVSERGALLEQRLGGLREQRRRQSDAAREASEQLDELRQRRHDAERRLEEIREHARRSELEEAEGRLRLETAVEGLQRDLECEPDVAIAAACPDLPPATTAAGRARELDRELRMMGPINPLALEEFEALQQRHEFLDGQLEDVKSSRRELARVIRAVNSEIVEIFSAAFADVAEHFSQLFATLFPGGQGRLRLANPDDLLETGIEVEARPLGKNVRKLSLLSGGERSLTALAFLFAVFRSRPSPFYLLDEVEAALDDVNLHRFLELVHEFRDEAQLLVVSHQKRTMEAADCLYGVTMQPGGSSKVISERVRASA